MSEDISYRQRRYLISMGIRTVCLLAAVILAGRAPMWLVGIMIAAAVVLPYVSVVFANGGREPENSPRFDTPGEQPNDAATHATAVDPEPERTSRKRISGHSPEIGS
jgi:Protein of unknown function (DUF3099)